MPSSEAGSRMVRRAAGAGLLALALASTASAQQVRGSSDGTARLQQAVMQLQGEKTQLAAENQKLKEQLARLEKEAEGLRAESGRLESRVSTAEAKAARSEAGATTRLEAAEAQLGEVVAKYRELAETLRGVEEERAALRQQVDRASTDLRSCASNNVALAAIADEALTRYEKKGCFGALAQVEPFTGIQRARIENAVSASREQVQALRVPAKDEKKN
jgi:chromosome segregation ATPase